MSEVRTYIVKQERELKIVTTGPNNAAHLAEYVFAGRTEEAMELGVDPNTEVRTIGLTVREES